MAKEFVLAIDQGTASTRAMLFNHDGTVAGVAQKEHRQIYPRPGWVEHDPREIWERTQVVVRGALAKGGIAPGDLAAGGITNEGGARLVWGRATGEPLYKAIVWQDTRTDAICNALAREGGQDRLRA